MSATFKPTYKYAPDFSAGNEIVVYGTVTFAGNYPTGGDVMSLAGFDILKTSVVPLLVEIYEAPPAGTSPTGYAFIYCPGTTLANGQLAVMNSTTQLAAGAYPGGLLAATVNVKIWALNQ